MKVKKNNVCPVCKRNNRPLTRHHIYPKVVWKDVPETQDKLLLVCQQCHSQIHREIRKRENVILQKHSYLYREVARDFTNGTIRVAWRKRYRKGK